MTDVEFFVTPGYGDAALQREHYSQAVRIGDRVEIAGQGGWDDAMDFPESLDEEIARAFGNVSRTLALAGAGWGHVVHVNSYHVGLDTDYERVNQVMADLFRRWTPERAPIWTCLGVAALGHPRMRVEVRVTAILPD
ncbi:MULTISPECIES: RidA family protein [Streptomyces]|uniref:RidA family protein n=1 Tax=Streptomyces TaxID=1883 RepID=UPI0033F1103D